MERDQCDQIGIGVRGWDLFSNVFAEDLPTSFTVAFLHIWFCGVVW